MKKRNKPKTLKTLYQRANRAAGQLKSIKKMVRANRPPEDILIQLLAINGSVYSLIYKHFNPIIRRHLVALLIKLSETENLPPAFLDFVDKVSNKRPAYDIKELPKVFYDLKQFLPPSYC